MPPVGAETPVKHASRKADTHASPEEKGGSKVSAQGEDLSPENKGKRPRGFNLAGVLNPPGVLYKHNPKHG